MKRVLAALPVAACLWWAGCVTTAPAPEEPKPEPVVARFFLEAKPSEAGVPVTLPRSGVTVLVLPKPVLVEYDVVNAEVAQVDLGRCLFFQFSPAATRDLYRLSVGAVGRRLVLALNDQFVGARPIEGAMSDGTVLTFVELPDEELPGLVERLKRTTADVRAAAKKAARP